MSTIDANGIPVVPLRGGAVFPGITTTISIGRSRSLAAAQAAINGDGQLLITVQLDATVEEPGQEDLAQIGVLAHIRDILRAPQMGGVQMLVELQQRVQFDGLLQKDPHLTGYYTDLAEEDEASELSEDDRQLMVKSIAYLEKYADAMGEVNQQVMVATRSRKNPAELSDYLSGLLTLPFEMELNLLTNLDGHARLNLLVEHLQKELQIAQIRRDIEGEARDGATKAQREFILREQMKAIKKELGEEPEDPGDQLREKILAAGMPDDIEEKALKELKRLSMQNPQAAEAGVIRTYLETLSDLPWSKETEDNFDLTHVRQILDEDHFGLEDVKDRIIEFVAVRKLAGKEMKGAIINLNGPPGVGKTSIASSVARAIGRELVRISLGGVRDEAEIRGHRRTYIGALPGRIIRALLDAGTKNPVIVLDEIDKVGADWRGDPSSALLEVLDPEQNHSFTDHYLEVAFDLSQVIFITTSNQASRIPPPLYDRMESITMPGYIEEEKVSIAAHHLVPKQIKGHGIDDHEITIEEEALRLMVRRYTREAGVRQLERLIGTLIRKVAVKVASGEEGPFNLTPEDTREYLGPEKFSYGLAEERDEVGVSTGLAVSSFGGDVMAIEVSLSEGSGKVILTGSLGDVMRESAQAALTYARSNARTLGLDPGIFDQVNLHIHVPAGATPKDGPSAGIALTTAIISAFTNRPVRRDVAMTGEVTLRGKVLEIGGLKGKTIAAHRAGIKTVLLPQANAKDIPELPDSVKEDLTLIPVTYLPEVLEVTLLDPIGDPFRPQAKSGSDEGSNLPLPTPNGPPDNPLLAK
ncbi:MAG: endopeptidase La [Ardenticatenaceae bacterium]|nr:endopeptidase La [Ardenticatenaceae bacterium]